MHSHTEGRRGGETCEEGRHDCTEEGGGGKGKSSWRRKRGESVKVGHMEEGGE